MRLKPLRQQTMVITGATSGIGLATARGAAKRGARVFLIARGAEDLRALSEEIQAAGGRAAYAVCDVADEAALTEAADRCRRLFGGIDTWVNNAGVSIYGAIRDTTLEDHKRLFETNYWGVVNGSMVAVEHLRNQGGGALINVGSVLSDAPIPVQGLYSASKHAVKGFTNALRMELMRERSGVAVTLVKPSAVDTPYKDHARNLTGEAMRNPPPVYAAHVVADVILHCAENPVREITVGGGGRMLAGLHHALPGLAEPLFAWLIPPLHRDPRGEVQGDDGLWDPTEDGLYEEAEYGRVRHYSLLAQARMHPRVLIGAAVGVAGALVLLSLLNRPRRSRAERVRDAGRERIEALAELISKAKRKGGRAAHRASDASRETAGGLAAGLGSLIALAAGALDRHNRR